MGEAAAALWQPGADGAVPPGRRRATVQGFAGTALLPMQRFRDIPVVPASRATKGLLEGGPAWPDFERQTLARHCRDGAPVDARPAPAARGDRIDGPVVWGGVARGHFGHLVSEYGTRLLQSLAERPDDQVLMLLDAETAPRDVPAFVWDVLAWYGLSRERVLLVDRPLTVGELWVAPQGEQMKSVGPGPAYLDLLDANTARNRLEPEPCDLLYVGRPGLCAQGGGGHAGEGYLVAGLRARGVRILDAATASLREQLALYAGARTIVFAEGSAVHGRQLLGRIDQTVVVLNRRPGNRLALPHLQPRCRAVQYVEAARSVAAPVRPRGPNPVVGLAFLDMPAVWDVFADLGVDLARGWDAGAFRAAQIADLKGWMRVRLGPGENVLAGPTVAALRQALAAVGLADAELPVPADGRGRILETGEAPWSN